MNSFLTDPRYPEKVYAGVLGKIIGVYLGRPFEGWTYERIRDELGSIDSYVNDRLNVPLVVADDDITGTFTFLRALADHGDLWDLTAKQIGETWLNYLIQDRTVLWWGGIGQSTEHTAYLRLKSGIPAPDSGSIELNGRTVAEQIGAQIFIDGWGLIHPGDLEAASSFAQKAASVSHDGEAVYAAQVVASLVAGAFIEKNPIALLDMALRQIPSDCLIAIMIAEIKGLYESGIDWNAAFLKLKARYGYEKYPGNCHVVPNHGVVILALLFGQGDFSRSLEIANGCGWDTDCNSGNVGCILGVLSGLQGIEAGYDWRSPVGDRILLPTADGGRCVSDAVQEALEIVRTAYALRKLSYSAPKNGARFSFVFPGSTQGFEGDGIKVSNPSGALELRLEAAEGSIVTPTFPTFEERNASGYGVMASPTLSPGQMVKAELSGAAEPIQAAIEIVALGGGAVSRRMQGPRVTIGPGETQVLSYQVPDLDSYPVTAIGIHAAGTAGSSLKLNWLSWEGPPSVTLRKTSAEVAWVNGVSKLETWASEPELIQNEGTGLFIHGSREWSDYSVEAEVFPFLADEVGIACHVQGMRRYYALLLVRPGKIALVKFSGALETLAEADYAWSLDQWIHLKLSIRGGQVVGEVNGSVKIVARDLTQPLASGAVAIVLTNGRCRFDSVKISPQQTTER